MNKSCIFPFIWNDKKYYACTSSNNGYLCSTKVDFGGNHVQDQQKSGFCSPDCMTGTQSKSWNCVEIYSIKVFN